MPIFDIWSCPFQSQTSRGLKLQNTVVNMKEMDFFSTKTTGTSKSSALQSSGGHQVKNTSMRNCAQMCRYCENHQILHTQVIEEQMVGQTCAHMPMFKKSKQVWVHSSSRLKIFRIAENLPTNDPTYQDKKLSSDHRCLYTSEVVLCSNINPK